MCRGEVARQMDWVLLDAHFALLQALIQAQVPGREAWVARRCQALNSLIRLTTIVPCRELLDLQEKVTLRSCSTPSAFLIQGHRYPAKSVLRTNPKKYG